MGRKLAYIETTVVSYFTAKTSRDLLIAAHQKSTHELWSRLEHEFESYVSALVYQEAGKGNPAQARRRLEALKPFRMLEIDEEAQVLAGKILKQRGVPQEYPEDALHIAVAAVNGIEVVVTWNFAHLNNPFTRATVRRIVEGAGYVCPEFCSPDELLEAGK